MCVCVCAPPPPPPLLCSSLRARNPPHRKASTLSVSVRNVVIESRSCIVQPGVFSEQACSEMCRLTQNSSAGG
eukprot:SAG22_NODE_1052_length_5802_cov_1.994564_1_plen_72_part_10